jgi:START domain-containing protein
VSRDPEWVDSVVEARVLRAIDPSDYVTYSHVGTPLTLADRDFVTQVALEVDPATKTLRIRMHSVSDPLAPKTRYVRGDVTESTLTLTSVDGGRRTHVVAEIHADPRGGIAPWIVNWFQRDWGYNTLKRLRAQVVKPSIRVDRGLKTLLEERGYFGSGREVRLEEASIQ